MALKMKKNASFLTSGDGSLVEVVN